MFPTNKLPDGFGISPVIMTDRFDRDKGFNTSSLSPLPSIGNSKRFQPNGPSQWVMVFWLLHKFVGWNLCQHRLSLLTGALNEQQTPWSQETVKTAVRSTPHAVARCQPLEQLNLSSTDLQTASRDTSAIQLKPIRHETSKIAPHMANSYIRQTADFVCTTSHRTIPKW